MEEKTLAGRLPAENQLPKRTVFKWLNKNIIIEAMCFMLMLNFFYEGVYKLVFMSFWGFWVSNEPIIKPIGYLLKYIVPAIELIISACLLKRSSRKPGLNVLILLQIVFIFWVASVYFFTRSVFWPCHAFWGKPTWLQRIVYSLLISWFALIVITLIDSTRQKEKV